MTVDLDVHKPNILLIITDQHFADVMSCVMGNAYLSTPNMDTMAANGIRFTRAYAPNPLCVPMRTSMMTGKYPHQTRVQTNSDRPLFDASQHRFMGRIFKDAGYETAYFGKWHVTLDPAETPTHGFDILTEDGKLDPEPCAAFLKQKHNKPFLAIASFLSPHEVCEWSRAKSLPGGNLGEPPPLAERPPMRINSEPPENETDVITHMRKSYQAHKLFPLASYTEDDWRRLIWGYYRLVERADRFIGVVLDALRESGQEKNTIVVFLSDHGDCHGAHRWNQKTVFYDESTRVPLIVSQKGKIKSGLSNVLVNTGIDIIPTLCDLAGIEIPTDMPGVSLKPTIFGDGNMEARDFIVSENHMIQCEPVDGIHIMPHGRMVRSDRYKYCIYSEGEHRESLVDMQADPGEMKNLAGDARFADVMKQHRVYLCDFAQANQDSRAMEMLEYVEN